MPSILGWSITLFFVNIFWVFFRAKDLSGAFKVLKAMIDFRSLRSFITLSYREATNPYLGNKVSMVLVLIAIIITLVFKNSFEKNKNMKFNNLNCIEVTIYFVGSILLLKRVATFLYFNF